MVGEILNDYFEEGDTVTEDQLLYMIDSDSLNSNVTRQQNSLKNARKALDDAIDKKEKLNVETDISGTVKKLYVEIGDDVNQGALIADIIDDDTMCIDIPFMDVDISDIRVGDSASITFDTYETAVGTVDKISNVSSVNSRGVSVRNVTISVRNTGSITTSTKAYAQIGDAACTQEAQFYYNDEGKVYAETSGTVTRIVADEGDKVSKNDIIVILESEDLDDEIDRLRDNVEEASDSLEDANDAFDNYNIKAPITGKVISKSYKKGDTLSSGGMSNNQLAVIYDMSALKFTMSIDELDIDSLDEGQEVIVTCDSREGQQYIGEISNISIQGTTTSGTTVYPVEVTIENVEDTSKRTVSDDGTVNKTYKTGMTSSEKTYVLTYQGQTDKGYSLIYDDGREIFLVTDADGKVSIYDGDSKLNDYIGGAYTLGNSFYSFSSDYSTVTIEVQNEKTMLKPGMNVDAEIVVEKRENAIAVPLAAVGRGNVVKVLKQSAKPENSTGVDGNRNGANNNAPNKKTSENINSFRASGYSSAPADSEYSEVRVTVGISDDEYVEITSGLEIGDVVIVDTSYLASNSLSAMFGMMGAGGMAGMGGMNAMGGGMQGMSGGMPQGGMGARPMGR